MDVRERFKNKKKSLDSVQRGKKGSRVKSKLCVFFGTMSFTIICEKKHQTKVKGGIGGSKLSLDRVHTLFLPFPLVGKIIKVESRVCV